MIKVCYVFFVGVFFAILQLSYFFSLETKLSSVYFTYFTVVIFWLIGVIFGLSISEKVKEDTVRLLSVISIYIFFLLIKRFPFKLIYLVSYIPLISFSSLYAGYFFKAQRKTFRNIKNLFFWENNGFILGFIISFFGFIKSGVNFLIWAPVASLFLVKFIEYIETALSAKSSKKFLKN